jgi:hypothetical protein
MFGLRLTPVKTVGNALRGVPDRGVRDSRWLRNGTEAVPYGRISIGKGNTMPDELTIQRAREDKREGKSPTTQAGEFVREEMHHIRQGKHGARSTKQAIAIGLSQARRAGVDLPPPKKGQTSERTRKSAQRAYERGHDGHAKRAPSPKRSKAVLHALEREGKSAASHKSLSKQAHSAARKRTAAQRHAAAMKAVRTKGNAGMVRAARKAARTRAAKS